MYTTVSAEERLEEAAKEIARAIRGDVMEVMLRDFSNREFMGKASSRGVRLCDLLGIVAEAAKVRVREGEFTDKDPKEIYDERDDLGEEFVSSLDPYKYRRVNKISMYRGNRPFESVLDIWISDEEVRDDA